MIFIKIIFYLILGILPSLIWLFYYLKKDIHPEPKKMILKVFLWGSGITLPVFLLEEVAASFLMKLNLPPLITQLIYCFLIIALIEEFFKYLVVRIKVFNSPHLDEPFDFIIYMIISALGFAAVENILYTLSFASHQMPFQKLAVIASIVLILRFVGATFLHTLCSALIGYSLAISFLDQKNRLFETISGILIAILLHGIYNFSIMFLEGYFKYLSPFFILSALAFFVFANFKKVQKIKSVTILNKKL